jgi:hydroxymethylglutaryl-CoA lyase
MRVSNNRQLVIQEVAPRDGFQIESKFIPTAQKIQFIDALSRTGLSKIEVTSFTAPAAIPALADAEAVMAQITRVKGVEYGALVPNLRGCERALSSRVDEINLVMSASESHNRANLRMSCERSLSQFSEIAVVARGRAQIRASLSTTFGCPFEGPISIERILELIERFVALQIRRVSLADTIGVANPRQVEQLCTQVRTRWPDVEFTAHFHNTRGMGLANAVSALRAGIDHFDASLGGLGGCPFAPGATGNICTEDLVHMFHAMGYCTGIDLDALLGVAAGLRQIVEHEVFGYVSKAGPWLPRAESPSS